MSTKIIQFQVCRPWMDNMRDMIFGLGDDGVVYIYDVSTIMWVPYTRNKFMAEEK